MDFWLKQNIREARVYCRLRRAAKGVRVELNQTPNAIAQMLKNKAIRGVRRDPKNCGIAKFTRLRLTGFEDPSVEVRNGKLRISCEGMGKSLVLRLSRGVRRFIRDFDNGYYPSLYTAEGSSARQVPCKVETTRVG